MNLTSATIEGFVKTILYKRFDGATDVPDCHREWWDMCCADNRYVAIAAPRAHAKSTSITHSYTLASLLFQESKFAIIVSDTEAQAILFLGDIKNELLENQDLIEMFGVRRFVKLSETDIIVEMEGGHKFRVMAKGAEQLRRGLKWDGKRPDLIIGDDLENEDLVASADRREKFRNWFTGTVLPSLSENGKIRIVGTILHLDSLLERLMPKGNAVEHSDLKEVGTNPKSLWKSARYRAHTPDFKKILWEKRYSREHFIKLRDYYISQGMADVYNRENLNYPIATQNAYFRREDFVSQSIYDKDSPKRYFAAADFAISQKARADYTVIVVGGMDENNILHIEDVRRGRWDAEEIINEMFSVQRRYKPDLFITEKGVIEKALGPFLKAEMLKRGVYINLYPILPTNDKQTRARGLQARLRQGGVRFDKEASWYYDYEEEMVRFPKDKHDDQVDATAWLGLVLDKIQDVEDVTPEDEEEEEEYASYQQHTGRSACTGY